MDIKKPVIVTALYDIGRDKWEKFTSSYGGYIHLMERTLSIDNEMVIYTQEKFKDQILELRKKYDTNLEKTVLIVQELEELDAYKLYNEKLTELMFSDEFVKKISFPDVPEMSKPLYNVIMFNKVHWIKHCVDNGYFDNDFVIWADAGGLREPVEVYQGKVWPNLEKLNKLDLNKITFFSHSAQFDIHDKEFHSLSQIRHIQGTAFFIPSHMINDLIIEFNQTIKESLSKNYIGSDEKVFDITYCKDKNKYNLIQCTWRTYFNLFKYDDLKSLDSVKKVFLDFGTHECQGLNHFINYELNMDSSWEIHTFEPNPLIDVDTCVKNFLNRNITVHRKAVWIRNDKVIFKQYGGDGTSQGSLLEETNGGKLYGDYYNETEVECINVLEFINTFDAESQIYIKMDIEWAEYQIFEYMLEKGWPKNIKKIWVEWHNIAENEFKIKMETLTNKIEKHNTKIINWH